MAKQIGYRGTDTALRRSTSALEDGRTVAQTVIGRRRPREDASAQQCAGIKTEARGS